MSKTVKKAVKKAVKPKVKAKTKFNTDSPALKAAKAYLKSKSTVAPKIQTQEQKAGAIPPVVNASFEGVRKIDHLPFEDQMQQIFNPLQAITKTDVKDAPSEATHVVQKKETPKG